MQESTAPSHVFETYELIENILLNDISPKDLIFFRQISSSFQSTIDRSSPLQTKLWNKPTGVRKMLEATGSSESDDFELIDIDPEYPYCPDRENIMKWTSVSIPLVINSLLLAPHPCLSDEVEYEERMCCETMWQNSIYTDIDLTSSGSTSADGMFLTQPPTKAVVISPWTPSTGVLTAVVRAEVGVQLGDLRRRIEKMVEKDEVKTGPRRPRVWRITVLDGFPCTAEERLEMDAADLRRKAQEAKEGR